MQRDSRAPALIEKMRVLLVMYRDDARSGGSVRVGQTLARGLLRSDVQVELCFAYGMAGPIGADAPCHYIGSGGPQDARGWLRFRRLVDRLKPDIVHFVDPVLWMMLSLVGSRPAVVTHLHGGIAPWRELSGTERGRWWILSRRTDLFVCITRGAKTSLVARKLIRGESAVVVYNAIDFDWFQDRPTKSHARADFGLPEEAFVIGMVCRLVQARAVDDFLSVLQNLGPDCYGLVVGDGPMREPIQALARKLGLRDRLRMPGSISDVRPAYAALDVLVHLALYEPFGLHMAEAMASKVPVFGLLGHGEYMEPEYPLITDANALFLTGHPRKRRLASEVEDPIAIHELARQIALFRQDRRTADARVDNAFSHVRSRFSITVAAEDMLSKYRTLLESRT